MSTMGALVFSKSMVPLMDGSLSTNVVGWARVGFESRSSLHEVKSDRPATASSIVDLNIVFIIFNYQLSIVNELVALVLMSLKVRISSDVR